MTTAWKLLLSKELKCAIGELSLVHLLTETKLLYIPGAPEYCCHVFTWNDLMIPLIDLGQWISESPSMDSYSYIAILAYQQDENIVQYIGIKLTDLPVKVEVDNKQECPFPSNFENWKLVSLTSFLDSKQVFPILNLKKINEEITHLK